MSYVHITGYTTFVSLRFYRKQVCGDNTFVLQIIDTHTTPAAAGVTRIGLLMMSESEQGAQLSQRDRAMLHVIEYFAVTQVHSGSFGMTVLSPY